MLETKHDCNPSDQRLNGTQIKVSLFKALAQKHSDSVVAIIHRFVRKQNTCVDARRRRVCQPSMVRQESRCIARCVPPDPTDNTKTMRALWTQLARWAHPTSDIVTSLRTEHKLPRKYRNWTLNRNTRRSAARSAIHAQCYCFLMANINKIKDDETPQITCKLCLHTLIRNKPQTTTYNLVNYYWGQTLLSAFRFEFSSLIF